MPNDAESFSQISQVPDVNDALSSVADNRKIFDTGDLSQVNLVYNNITFQVYPVPKITDENDNGTDVMPREDESDTYNFSQEPHE